MDLKKPFRPQTLTECVKRVVCWNLVLIDTDGFAIDIDLSQFLAEFSIR
jgi:hypothetical protein